jgi:electron transport complex protein RnfE
VVNCIVLGRAEAFAFKNGLLPSIADGLGIGVGFTLSLAALGGVREILGAGTLTLWEGIELFNIANFFPDFNLLSSWFRPPARSSVWAHAVPHEHDG